MYLGCVSIRVLSMSWRRGHLLRTIMDRKGWEARDMSEYSWWELQPEQRPRGMVENNECFQHSIMKLLCWPHPPEVSLRTSATEPSSRSQQWLRVEGCLCACRTKPCPSRLHSLRRVWRGMNEGSHILSVHHLIPSSPEPSEGSAIFNPFFRLAD